MNDIILNELSIYIKSRYNNCSLMMVTGSYLTNNYNEFSDIDIVLITDNRNNVFNETFHFKNKKIQAITIPRNRVEEIIWADYMSCNGAIIHMIASGKPLIDKNDYLSNLINFSSLIYERGGRRINFIEIKHLLTYISSLLNDIKGNKIIYDNLICINELTDKSIELLLKSQGYWAGKGKYRMKSFKKFLPHLYDLLIISQKEIFIKEDLSLFISFIENCLNSFSGVINNFSYSNFFNHKLDFYVIQIDDINNEIINLFKDTNIKYFYQSHHPLIGNNNKESLYIIIPIKTDSDFLKIDNILNENILFTSKNVKFPIDFNPFLKLGIDSNATIICEILINIKDAVINQYNNDEFKIALGINIIDAFFDSIIKDEFKDKFAEYLYQELLILSTESKFLNQNNFFNYKKSILIKNMNDQFLDQKDEIKSVIKEKEVELFDLKKYLKSKFSEIKNSDDLYYYRKNSFDDKNKYNFILNKELIITILRSLPLDINKISYIFFIYKNLKK